MNCLHIIHPYKFHGTWVFDDIAKGFIQEPFVCGIDRLIDQAVVDVPDAEHGFTMVFSDQPFPCAQISLDWVRSEHGGNWYRRVETNSEGWLCPGLLRYFATPPAHLYVQFRTGTDDT